MELLKGCHYVRSYPGASLVYTNIGAVRYNFSESCVKGDLEEVFA